MRISLRPPIQKWVQKKPFPIRLLKTTQIVTTVRPRVYEEEVSRKRTSSSSLSPNSGKAAVGTSRPILVSRLCAVRRSWCLRSRLLPTGRKNLAGASRPPWSRTCPPYPRPSGGSQFTLARSSGAGRVPPSHRPPRGDVGGAEVPLAHASRAPFGICGWLAAGYHFARSPGEGRNR